MSDQQPSISSPSIEAAATLAGLAFTPAERDLMQPGLAQYRDKYANLRAVPLPNDVAPALRFDPRLAAPIAAPSAEVDVELAGSAQRPTSDDELAFAPVIQLARLLAAREVSSVELTQLYLDRIRCFDPALEAVVTLTDDLALQQARQADAELAAGRRRGPLHGVPWGAKDLLATDGIRTTWGAGPYRDQIFHYDATVVERLHAAGCVLLAKLTVGELAWGDVWYSGQTKNPWKLDEGSSGSSAGPGAAAAGGLVGFAIGTETWGSIVSPSTRCGVTGLRPTFGRVSRHGAMALSWSLDKIGPMCRSAEDCALVFAAIHGPDGRDSSVIDVPFQWPQHHDIRGLRIGVVEAAFGDERAHADNDARVLDVLRELGAELVPIELPDYPIEALSIILDVEAAAAFDELTRSDRDEMLVRQGHDAWPNVLRRARLIPAVEYVQANRVRTLVMRAMAQMMSTVDAYVAPTFGANNLLLTNMTGHPALTMPNGWTEHDTPTSITLTGQLFGESELLRIGCAFQTATDFHLRRPPLMQTS